jgi:hypothetical protein
MNNTVFRTKQNEETIQEKLPEAPKELKQISETEVETPYSLYESTHEKPLIADYFQLGDQWNDSLGGFKEEVDKVENYLKKKVRTGELQDTIPAVKDHIKSLYKLCSINKNERVTMQIEKLAAYTDYILKMEDIKNNYYKYG